MKLPVLHLVKSMPLCGNSFKEFDLELPAYFRLSDFLIVLLKS